MTVQNRIKELRAELAAAEAELAQQEVFETEAKALRLVWEPRGYVLLRKEKKTKPRPPKKNPLDKNDKVPVVENGVPVLPSM